jgi:oligopeptide transport system substrate-binding protein
MVTPGRAQTQAAHFQYQFLVNFPARCSEEVVMFKLTLRQFCAGLAILFLLLASISCTPTTRNEEFFGKVVPPADNVFRYISGDEPESLDPQLSSGQPEGRIFLALYEGLVEYDAKTMDPVPAIAERWDENNDSSELVFHLRHNARWSNGDSISAKDFVYTFRRGVSPELLSRSASNGFYIKNAENYNQGNVFVRDPATNEFLLEKDFLPTSSVIPLSQTPLGAGIQEYKLAPGAPPPALDTAFHQMMHSPERLALPGSEKARNALLAKNPKLQAAVAGKEFVPVRAEDIGVEAVDDYTVRISLKQNTPFFVGLLANQFFRLVPQKVVEAYGRDWTNPAHIVTNGPFKVKSWRPYNELAVEKDPMYWDAATVRLDGIRFYPMADQPTMMNLYRVGDIDAASNHAIISAWVDEVRYKKDYMTAPEAAVIYIVMNTTKPPMNDIRVRRAFDLAMNKDLAQKWRKIVKPLNGITPNGIFAGYPEPKGGGFDPDKARALLGEAGFPVIKNGDGTYSCPSFPIDQVEYTFPTAPSNKITAEFWQAQWKQHLGITVPLRSMEFKTFVDARSKLEYKGFAFGAWGADYMDPFTFLSLFYTAEHDNNTGWWDKRYVELLDEANRNPDRAKRYALLGQAEQLMIDAQPILPVETATVNWTKKPYVKGMYPNAGSLFPWKHVYFERDRSKWDSGTPSLIATTNGQGSVSRPGN